VNSDFKEDRILIRFSKIYGLRAERTKHTTLPEFLAIFKISTLNIGAFTIDNATDNDAAFKRLENTLYLLKG
jgi:hypothetical protein